MTSYGRSKMKLALGHNAAIKEQNLKVILNVIREAGLISRAEISRQTGLSRSTVSELVGFLLRQGIIEEAGTGDSIGGRRPILIKIRSKGRVICAIHLDDDGTLEGRAEDLAGAEINTATDKVREADELVPGILRMIEKLTNGYTNQPAALALALPGIVSPEGTILSAVNLGWSNVSVVQPLTERLGIPIKAENATGLAAYGEMSARDLAVHNLVYLRIGRVVGAGVIANNRLHHGLRGSAAEIGHMVLDIHGERCKCGRRGCLETKVSRRAALALLHHYQGTLPPGLSIENVFEYLVEGDRFDNPVAQKVLTEIARSTATAVVNVLNVLGPDVVVIESVLCDSRTYWTVLIETAAEEALPFAEGKYQLVASSLGKEAVIVGAIAYATRLFYDNSQIATIGL
ncbi:MAG TPA: ROK family protein [Firmicutes bacterium]|nr:ROK family protein [Bacillota bacterium]